MTEKYYAGHSFEWMQRFLQAIPKSRVKCIAVCLAEAIHHKFIYTKQPVFNLSHSTLEKFGITRQSSRPYLQFFQEAELINVTFRNKASPIIQLLLLPTNYYNINNKTLKHYNVGDTCNNCNMTMLEFEHDSCYNYNMGQPGVPKQGNPASKGTQQARQPRKQGNLGSKGTRQVRGPSKQWNPHRKVTQQARQRTKQGNPVSWSSEGGN